MRRTNTRAWRTRFLAALCKTISVSKAAKAARVARSVVYAHRAADPEFAAAWDDALSAALDQVEAQLYRRAVEGTEEPIYHRGKLVGKTRRFSDTAAIFLLKSWRPERYRETIHQHITGGPYELRIRALREERGLPPLEQDNAGSE